MQDLNPDVPRNIFFSFLRSLLRIKRKLYLKIRAHGKVVWGKNVEFGPKCSLNIPEYFKAGNNFRCGKNFFVQSNVEASDDILISSDVSFVGHDHFINKKGYNNFWSGRRPPSTVILKGDNFIGYRATLIGNIKVGEGAIIAAGAVVVEDVAPYSVVGGIPARFIGKRRK